MKLHINSRRSGLNNLVLGQFYIQEHVKENLRWPYLNHHFSDIRRQINIVRGFDFKSACRSLDGHMMTKADRFSFTLLLLAILLVLAMSIHLVLCHIFFLLLQSCINFLKQINTTWTFTSSIYFHRLALYCIAQWNILRLKCSHFQQSLSTVLSTGGIFDSSMGNLTQSITMAALYDLRGTFKNRLQACMWTFTTHFITAKPVISAP